MKVKTEFIQGKDKGKDRVYSKQSKMNRQNMQRIEQENSVGYNSTDNGNHNQVATQTM